MNNTTYSPELKIKYLTWLLNKTAQSFTFPKTWTYQKTQSLSGSEPSVKTQQLSTQSLLLT